MPSHGRWIDLKANRRAEAQIVRFCCNKEAAATTVEVCRRYGISGAKFYKGQTKLGGLNVCVASGWRYCAGRRGAGRISTDSVRKLQQNAFNGRLSRLRDGLFR
jgi:hypothetical protein